MDGGVVEAASQAPVFTRVYRVFAHPDLFFTPPGNLRKIRIFHNLRTFGKSALMGTTEAASRAVRPNLTRVAPEGGGKGYSMLKLEKISVADNIIAINGVAVGVVTDATAEAIIALVNADAQGASPSGTTVANTSSAKPRKATKRKAKTPSTDAVGIPWKEVGTVKGLGYVVSTSLYPASFKALRDILLQKDVKYAKANKASGFKGGFVFKTKQHFDEIAENLTVLPVR